MLPVSEAFKNKINSLNRDFECRVIFNNLTLDNNHVQSIEYSSSIIESGDFEIGTANMAMVEIEVIDEDTFFDGYPFESKEVDVEIGIKLENGNFEYASLGKFTIEKPIRKDKIIRLTAVDRMHKFEKPYFSSLAYPAVTLSDIVIDVCAFVGVELASSNFPNADYVVDLPKLNQITCRQVIAQIAELAGGYARITRDGKLEIFNVNTSIKNAIIYASNSLFASNDHVFYDELIAGALELTREDYISFENSEQASVSIDKVIVTSNNISVEKGEGNNPYYIEDNIFCQNPSKVVDGIYEALNGLSYIPFTTNWAGNPAVDPGDMITIKTVGGHFNTIVTSRNLTYTGGLRETYTAVGKSETERQSTSEGTVVTETKNVKEEIKVIEEKTEGLVKNTDFEHYKNQTGIELNERVEKGEFTLYQQNVDYELSQRVKKGNELKNEVTQNAESWGLSINGKLTGQQYSFDGNNFKIGNIMNGIVEHNPISSTWKHNDGSYTKASNSGLERYINAVAHKYHDLMLVGEVTTSVAPETIFLGDKFKGKDFTLIPFVKSYVDVTNDTFITNVEINIIERNVANATVIIEGFATIKLTETDSNGFIKSLGSSTSDLILGYVAIA